MVFGALSAALIILLTTLLVKRVSSNRTTEIVEMKRLAPPSEDANRAGDSDSSDEFSSGRGADVVYSNDEIFRIIDDPIYND
jgi:hypothetical protein